MSGDSVKHTVKIDSTTAIQVEAAAFGKVAVSLCATGKEAVRHEVLCMTASLIGGAIAAAAQQAEADDTYWGKRAYIDLGGGKKFAVWPESGFVHCEIVVWGLDMWGFFTAPPTAAVLAQALASEAVEAV